MGNVNSLSGPGLPQRDPHASHHLGLILNDVTNEPDPRRPSPGGEHSAGRSASRGDLRRRLVSAPPEFLAGAVENPELTPRELVLLLRNRQAQPDLLRRVATDREWMRNLEVRRAVALHPRTPLAILRNLVPQLYWNELLEVALSPQVNPVARRQAEIRLIARVEELAEGERVTLARRASRAVISVLIDCGSTRELQGLLGNPRMIESDAVRIASRKSASPDALALLAAHDRWGHRREVRLALIANSRTPVPSSLRILRGLSVQDLRRLLRDERVPRIVRVGAERLLKSPNSSCGPAAVARQRDV